MPMLSTSVGNLGTYVVSVMLDDAGVNLFPNQSVALRFLM